MPNVPQLCMLPNVCRDSKLLGAVTVILERNYLFVFFILGFENSRQMRVHCRTLPHTTAALPHTATRAAAQCRAHCNTKLTAEHCRAHCAHTATVHAAAFTLPRSHCCIMLHCCTLPHCRTLPHCQIAAHCRAHCHTAPSALTHTVACTARTLPCALPHIAARTANHFRVHCHTLPSAL
jgi:hypothetical protein